MIRPLKMISLVSSSFNNKNTQSRMLKIQQIKRSANVPRVKFVLNGECGKLTKKRRMCDELNDDNNEENGDDEEDETGYYYFLNFKKTYRFFIYSAERKSS